MHEHHTVNYVELAAVDMDAARRFYTAAFDWQFQDYGPDYAGMKVADREFGGLRREAQVTRGGPLLVVFSRDLEATLERVRQAGGEIVVAPFDFPGGRRFHFTDPSGNELAVWAEAPSA